MKHLNNNAELTSRLLKLPAALGVAAFLLCGAEARATNYAGNGNTGFGGPIGNGTLTLTDDGTNIHGTLTVGANMNDVLVIYIDTGAGGGFSSTTGMQDDGDGTRIAISGYNYGAASVMTFMSGFNPQYGIGLGPSATSFGGLWKLANGVANSFPFIASVNLTPDNNTGPYTFSFPAADIGLTPGVTATIKIFGTLISDTAYRSTEAIAGNDTTAFSQGNHPFTQTAFSTYTFDASAPILIPVTFQVDMTEQVTNGNFKPGSGDTVYAAGTFQSVPWSGFLLTNTPVGANTNIYTGTYLDSDPTNTQEEFKFYEVSAAGPTTNYEATDNRPFTLLSGGVTNALVYFTDLWPSPSATTNSVTFQIDMTSAIEEGDFTNGTGSVEVFGTFSSPNQWSPGFVLTNNPLGANPNLYSGTTNDGNYPGTWEQYKFVILGATTNYESIANRDFVTPTNSETLPLAYYNNVFNLVSVPVTFQVDMTSQILTGNVNLGAGNTVGVIASSQNPAYSGATLTNNPLAANTNIFSGTFIITNQPGAAIQYKFVYYNPGINYEEPATTDGGNRAFLMPTNATVLPLVLWNDQYFDTNNLLPAQTLVMFTVDMANAVDEYGTPFDPSIDGVIINGSFIPPSDNPTAGGWINALWTDPFPNFDYPSQSMTESNLSTLYTNYFLIPTDSELQVSYKYGIWHNENGENTNCDNEAPIDDNHYRYIRAVGTYNFPVDTFGQQTNTNPAIAAEADEASFGNLAASGPSAGKVTVSWLGRPGVYLQTNNNLASGVWVTVTNSDVIGSINGGVSTTNIPASGGKVFYRLVSP